MAQQSQNMTHLGTKKGPPCANCGLPQRHCPGLNTPVCKNNARVLRRIRAQASAPVDPDVVVDGPRPPPDWSAPRTDPASIQYGWTPAEWHYHLQDDPRVPLAEPVVLDTDEPTVPPLHPRAYLDIPRDLGSGPDECRAWAAPLPGRRRGPARGRGEDERRKIKAKEKRQKKAWGRSLPGGPSCGQQFDGGGNYIGVEVVTGQGRRGPGGSGSASGPRHRGSSALGR